jgi:hypothetical protein
MPGVPQLLKWAKLSVSMVFFMQPGMASVQQHGKLL